MPGQTGTTQQGGIGAGEVEKVGPVGVAEGEDGRHRLHKEPPASHPAAQANQGNSSGGYGSGGMPGSFD